MLPSHIYIGRGGLKVSVGKGGRLIVVHVGSANTGFVPECKLLFRSKKANLNSDYHTEMNLSLFREWFYEMLCLLEEGSIIVMDNASYHSAFTEKVPRSNWEKCDIIEWLRGKNAHFEEQ